MSPAQGEASSLGPVGGAAGIAQKKAGFWRENEPPCPKHDEALERKRRAAQTVMETAAIERIVEAADLTVSLRATAPTLVVIDEALIADEFKIPQAPRARSPALE